MTAPPHLRLRAPGTRLGRRNSGPQRLETVAAEFAMMAQRRARLMRQIDLLDRQRRAADDSYAQLERRMAQLQQQMGRLDAVPPPPPPPQVAAPAAPAEPAMPPPRHAPPVARRRGVVLEY